MLPGRVERNDSGRNYGEAPALKCKALGNPDFELDHPQRKKRQGTIDPPRLPCTTASIVFENRFEPRFRRAAADQPISRKINFLITLLTQASLS